MTAKPPRPPLAKAPRSRKASPAPELTPASEEAAADTLHRLRRDIVSGALRAGARLRFSELQRRYEIGTSPLREALSRLAGDRLVLQEINRGFRVPPLSIEDFDDIAGLRAELEVRALRAAVAQGDEAWEEGIVLAHHRLQRLGARESMPQDPSVPEEWERRHSAFHRALIAAGPSPWTLDFCRMLNDQFDRYRRWAGRDPEVQVVLARHHSILAEAAIDRDVEGAVAILTQHITLTADTVRSRLAEAPSAATHSKCGPSRPILDG